MSSSTNPSDAPSAEYAEHLSNRIAIPSLSHENYYFHGLVGNPDPTEFIIGETNRIPFRLTNPDLGPMTPTLIDISMITGLDVTSSANPMSLNTKNQYDFKTKSIGGWSDYVAAYIGQGPVTPREHVAFLLMWLEKFLFCRSSCSPTTNWQFVAEALETKRQFPLGKILLGYLYQMLNNASTKLIVGSVVGAGGPWWLLQSWLNLVVMRFVNRPSVTETKFPRLEPTVNDDEEELTHRRCTSYGEYASTPTDAGAKLSAELLKDWFCNFYEGFQKDARVWFLYGDSTLLENPWDFRFEDINNDRYQKPREIFLSAITPCILPVGIYQGRNIQVSYEFYHPMSSARQFGMGQLPIGLFFADKIQCRGEISSSLMMDRLLNLQGPPLGSIDTIKLATFRSKSLANFPPDLETTESSPPHQSNSGRDIEYAPRLIPNGGGPSPPVIGYNAPKSSALLQGLIREPANADKKRKTRSSAVNISAPAPKKKTKTKKTTPADDLPALDPSIEQALDEEIIEDDIDEAAAEKKKTAVKKKSAATKSKPAPLVLVDLFSFDIKDYLDEGEEDTTSKALAPLSDDVKKTLENISHRLEASSLDNLVVDCGSIRTRLHEIQALIPDELANILTPAVYLEQHQFKLEKAKLRLTERRERKDIEATIQANRQLVHEENSKLDQLSEGPIKSNIDRLEARKIELLAQCHVPKRL
uniref:Aminotransferase-like protein n=2 Tax=Oryza sativa subsp. japonica TaxID=39947 RepID=Q10IM7_ORYSJ|nr:hypothetical protein [Oryza sativa Japonica Group]ABF96962.1 hypothetical protein LOC_Os03g33730 [Oryza sativa Japonica Group]